MFRVIFIFITCVEHDNLPRFFRAALHFFVFQNVGIRLFVHSISEEKETALFEFGFQEKLLYIIYNGITNGSRRMNTAYTSLSVVKKIENKLQLSIFMSIGLLENAFNSQFWRLFQIIISYHMQSDNRKTSRKQVNRNIAAVEKTPEETSSIKNNERKFYCPSNFDLSWHIYKCWRQWINLPPISACNGAARAFIISPIWYCAGPFFTKSRVKRWFLIS